MQIRIFTVSITDPGIMQDEMNKFLRANKVLETQTQLISNGQGTYWCFCIKYLQPAFGATVTGAARKDYKEILDEKTFERFSKMRQLRKELATEDGVPAYAIFTDEELAGLAAISELNGNTMSSVKGIGAKKVERYGSKFMALMNTQNQPAVNETRE